LDNSVIVDNDHVSVLHCPLFSGWSTHRRTFSAFIYYHTTVLSAINAKLTSLSLDRIFLATQRCIQLSTNGALSHCPLCDKPTQGLALFPMLFRELDDARRTAAALASQKSRGKKRKGGSGSDPTDDLGGYVADRRTGRWTNEEMIYCDKLISAFERGCIPIADGIKLNEFLGNMLKSKQSRLTKKMKNAKLSTKVYKRLDAALATTEAREFSELEESFFQGIQELQERAEMKFHMQKEWREQFSQVCASIGQPLDADAWLTSVEEMDRRASQAKDAARMSKRKLMMGVALKTDSRNLEQGVFIERTEAEARATSVDSASISRDVDEELMNMFSDDKPSSFSSLDYNGKSSSLHAAPFLAKVAAYLQRHAVPFEHVDLWVPSFVELSTGETNCRLCYAGSATVDRMLGEDSNTRDITGDEKFNLCAFGDYSQKFSFDVGCGESRLCPLSFVENITLFKYLSSFRTSGPRLRIRTGDVGAKCSQRSS
jgi:hypothetical protein